MFPDLSVGDVEDEVTALDGSLGSDDEGLPHSVLEGEDKQDAQLLAESLDYGMGSFHPDLMMEQLVKNYQLAQQLYGDTILRLLSTYEPGYLEKNIRIPEFQKELKSKLQNKVNDLKEKGLLSGDNEITDEGLDLAAFHLYSEELDKLKPKGLHGERVHKQRQHYGEGVEVRPYQKGHRYADLALRKSITRAIKRGHDVLEVEDLQTYEPQAKGEVHLVYALDASGSMKGKKLQAAKKAGVALAHTALQNKDKVGLLVFGEDVKNQIKPTTDFDQLLHTITGVKASKQTDFADLMEKAGELFSESGHVTKHLILLTDAMPTVGEDPEVNTLKGVADLAAQEVTVSVIGIALEEEGEALAAQIAELGRGGLSVVQDPEQLDLVVLQDYYEHY